MSSLTEYVETQNPRKDVKDVKEFIQSLDWKIYNREMVFGEVIKVYQMSYLNEMQTAEYYACGASSIDGLRLMDISSEYDREKWSYSTILEIEELEAKTGERITGMLTGMYNIKPEHLGDPEKFAVLEPPSEAWSIPSPCGTEYYPFQRAAMWEMIHRPRLLLADDMGLGKTIQTCGMLNAVRPDRVCVIATAGLKKVWQRELHKWLVYETPIRVLSGKDMALYEKAKPGIFITNYESVRDFEAREFLHDEWDQVILDESHNIKNHKSKTARAILGSWAPNGEKLPGLQAPRKLMLTGTPMPNRSMELWTTFSYLFPEVFTEEIYPDYRREFKGTASRVYVRNGGVLKRWFQSIAVRRRKAACQKDMPPKERETQLVSVNAMNMSRLHEMENQALAEAFGGYAQSISFTQWSAIRAECARIKAANNAEYVLRFLFNNPGDKIVVFRHHEVTRKALSEALHACKIRHEYYEGGMSEDAKEDAVDNFQNDPECRAIIVSIKAGGLGITLTASTKAIFAEIDCVPSSLLQCEDRIHRIGQDRQCQITYLYIHGSIEEHMGNIVAAKLPQIEGVVDDDSVNPEHLVEVEVDLAGILETFRENQLGWDRLRDIHDILRTATKPDGHGGLERKYDWHVVGRFAEQYPEYKQGVRKKEREGKKAS